MIAVCVRKSVCHAAKLGGVQCVRGDLVQPFSNHFGFLIAVLYTVKLSGCR